MSEEAVKRKNIYELFEMPSNILDCKDGAETIIECNCTQNQKVCKLKVKTVNKLMN